MRQYIFFAPLRVSVGRPPGHDPAAVGDRGGVEEEGGRGGRVGGVGGGGEHAHQAGGGPARADAAVVNDAAVGCCCCCCRGGGEGGGAALAAAPLGRLDLKVICDRNVLIWHFLPGRNIDIVKELHQ